MSSAHRQSLFLLFISNRLSKLRNRLLSERMTQRNREGFEKLDMEDEKVDARELSEERKRGARSRALRSGLEQYILFWWGGGLWMIVYRCRCVGGQC
jgi:hypothetical protein